METEQEDGRARERRNGFDAAHNMVPTWEHNMARVNQTGGITANYGGRLIPCLRTSQELLRWKENRMRTSEEGEKKKTIYTPLLLLTLDIWSRNSCVIQLRALIFPLFQHFLSSLRGQVYELSIIKFMCLELCSGLNFPALTFFAFLALRSRACLFAGWAMSKQTREMSKEKERRWNLL